jgi:ABC-type branched-subunit amino acid transport system substrate-binding protein
MRWSRSRCQLILVAGSLAGCAFARSQGITPTTGIPAAEVPARGSGAASGGSTGALVPERDGSASAATPAGAAGGPAKPANSNAAALTPGSAILGREGRGAEADFEAARTHFDRGETASARAALESFVKLHPEHPSRIFADLMLARLALQRAEPKEARRILEPWVGGGSAQATGGAGRAAAGAGAAAAETPPAGVLAAGASPRAAATYYLGLAEVRLGNLDRGRELLLPFLPRSGSEVDPADEAGIELRGALAEAVAPQDPAGALELWGAYFRVGRDCEKAWARKRATEIAAQVNPEGAWRAYGAASPGGLARATLGSKAALYLRGRGDPTGATFVDSETNAARHALGFDSAVSRVGPGDPNRIGLAIPLSGKFQVVGEAALRAAMLAGGTPARTLPGAVGGTGTSATPPEANALAASTGAGATVPGPLQLIVRDTGTDPERAARSVTELSHAEAVIGVISAAGAAAGARMGSGAVAQASEDGIPLLALDDTAPGALTSAFQMIHAPDARARSLAAQALRLGVKTFALLGPDHAASRKLREAFRKAVVEGGGTVVVEATYVPGATSFAPAVGQLKRARFEAVFVPDAAERIALIAPALAVADLWPQPWVKPAPGTARAPSRRATRAARRRAREAGAQPGRKGDGAGDGSDGDDAEPAVPVLLLSTANDLSGKLLEQAGRYVQGALLCPGFFAAVGNPPARSFAEAYRLAYGRDPHAVEAYAYDAVAAFRAMAQRGARTRADMIRALGAKDGRPLLAGLTGNLTFGPDHGRVDEPIVYVVDGADIRPLGPSR